MTTRMQQRRGLAAQWTAANPVLAAGEIGFETDTRKFKMGDGTRTWSQLEYFANAAELTAAINAVVGMAPETLNTLSEISDALGDNPDFLSALVTKTEFDAAALTASGSLTEARNYASNSLASHTNNSINVHGIADTAALATKTYADTAVSNHSADTTDVHGIADTMALATKTYANDAVSTAVSALTKISVGLANVDDTADANKPVSGAQASAIATAKTEAITAAGQAADTKVSTHNTATTNVHGITDTAALATKTYADSAVTTAVSGLTKSSVGLANVDNTSDANKPVSSATQTALNLKANLAGPTFTGTVSGITATMVGLGNVNNTADSAKPISTATQTALDAKLALAGGTMTGALTLSADPTSALHAVTKQYADGLAAGINFHQAVVAASTGNLAGVYNNGTNGLGATITASANAAIGTIDGATVSVGSRILLRAQTDATQNGIYTVTDLGSSSSKWVVTRATDADNNPSGELATGDFCFVTGGSTNAAKGYILSTTGTITIGTTNVNYTQFNASEAVTAGTNITKTGSTIGVADAPTFAGLVTASAAGVAFSDGTQTKAGVPSITNIPTALAAGAQTIASGRADQFIPLTGAVVITLPATGYSTGQSIDFYQESSTGAYFATTNGVVGTPGLKFRTTYSVATAMKTASGWLVFGDLSA